MVLEAFPDFAGRADRSGANGRHLCAREVSPNLRLPLPGLAHEVRYAHCRGELTWVLLLKPACDVSNDLNRIGGKDGVHFLDSARMLSAAECDDRGYATDIVDDSRIVDLPKVMSEYLGKACVVYIEASVSSRKGFDTCPFGDVVLEAGDSLPHIG